MDKILITNNEQDTMKLGELLASILCCGTTICLRGDLGCGKTTLVRGIAKGLNINEVIQSPTFNIMKLYLKGDKALVHIDAYRLADINTDIGLDEYIGYEMGITVIEWPDYISNLLPMNTVNISFINLGENSRKICISSNDSSLLEKIKL